MVLTLQLEEEQKVVMDLGTAHQSAAPLLLPAGGAKKESNAKNARKKCKETRLLVAKLGSVDTARERRVERQWWIWGLLIDRPGHLC